MASTTGTQKPSCSLIVTKARAALVQRLELAVAHAVVEMNVVLQRRVLVVQQIAQEARVAVEPRAAPTISSAESGFSAR